MSGRRLGGRPGRARHFMAWTVLAGLARLVLFWLGVARCCRAGLVRWACYGRVRPARQVAV